MDNSLKKTAIEIKGIESRFIESLNTRVYDVDTNQGKFQFWETKKDNKLTKAFEQYQKFRFIAGETLEVSYKESDGSFINSKSGKKVNKINKTIVLFSLDQEGNPVHPSKAELEYAKTKQTPLLGEDLAPRSTSNKDLIDLTKRVEKIEGILKENGLISIPPPNDPQEDSKVIIDDIPF